MRTAGSTTAFTRWSASASVASIARPVRHSSRAIAPPTRSASGPVDDVAERVLGMREARGRRGDAEVAAHGEVEAAGERGAVDRRDRRHREAQHRVVVAVARRPERPRERLVFERAGNSDRSKPAEKVSPAPVITTALTDSSAARSSSASLISSRSAIDERVLLRRPIERQHGVRVVAFDPQIGVHPSVQDRARRAASAVAVGALEEPGPLDDDARDPPGGDQPAAVADRDPEREAPALDRLQRRLGRDPTTDRRRREVGQLDLVTDGRRVGRRWSATASTVASSASATTRGVPSTGTSPLCNASDVSASATMSVTDPTRPGFTPMDVR